MLAISGGTVTINQSNFTKGRESHINIRDSKIHLDRVNIYDSASDSSNGHGLRCEYCKDLQIKNSLFKNLAGHKGGAIHLSNLTGSEATISDTEFEGNTAWHIGGAIFVATPKKLNITSSLFLNNSA